MENNTLEVILSAYAARCSAAKRRQIQALTAALSEAPDNPANHASSPAELKAWRAAVLTLTELATAMRAAKPVQAALSALSKALTSPPSKTTQYVEVQAGSEAKSATGSRNGRSKKVAETLALDERLGPIASALASPDLTEAQRAALLETLSQSGPDGFSPEDRKQVAKAVTGQSHRSGKQALDDLKRYTWSRLQARASNASWGETAAKKI